MAVFCGAGLILLAVGAAHSQNKPQQNKPRNQRTVASATGFDTSVTQVVGAACAGCHNPQMASGGLNLLELAAEDSLTGKRELWERVLRRVKAGEMPPAGIPKPAGLPGMVSWLEQTFEKADRNVPVDPGRVTARHLNRVEYQNTIRDLLGVNFQATKDFPVDDSGDGFDNIGDVLSISPLLSERYVAAAERLASRALGLVALPEKPVKSSYADDDNYKEVVPFNGTSGSAKRVSPNAIEASHRVVFDGQYTIQAGLAGGRPDPGKPVTLALWMDGEIVQSKEISMVTPDGKFFAPYEVTEMKAFLPEGLHTFRLAYLNDPEGDAMNKTDALNPKKNKYIQLIGFVGPEKSAEEPASRKRILICDPASGSACLEKIFTTLATRAWRRPVTKGEVATLTNLVAASRRAGSTLDQALEEAVEAVLASPNFLFHIEHDPGGPGSAGKPHPISGVELASRLSYFIWSSQPDDELLNAGISGALLRPATLDAQIRRLLDDPRSSALADNFAGQWLEVRNLDSIRPDPDKFPDWGPALKEAMRTETRLFFDAILRGNRPISEFLNARYTFLNEPLARLYGIEGVTGPLFRRVELTTDQRGGILGQASVLAVSSYPSRTSVVLRGKYILENVLGTPPPPPPPNVPTLDEDSVGTLLSLRQQMEKHRSNPVCASCHSKMDPLGFALEHYDAIGKWREKDGKFAVDSSGTLPDGQTFDGPAAMRQALSERMPGFAQCLIEKMLVYSLGRGVGPSDRRTVAQIQQNWAAQGYKFQSLIYEVAHSVPFQSRRGEIIESRSDNPVKEVAKQ
jgi:hypothetical protein